MTGVYTPEFFQHLKSNLNGFISKNPEKPQLTDEEKLYLEKKEKLGLKKEYASYDNHYFQVLIFDGDVDSLKQDDDNHKFKLVYGTRKNLIEKYGLHVLSLPTSGVKVDPDFMHLYNTEYTNLDVLRNAEYSTVRFLLQSRRLSQVTASTWLKDNEDTSDGAQNKLKIKENQRKLVRKIFHTYNIKPDIYWERDEKSITIEELKKKLKEGINKHFLIKLNSISFSSIALVLLLSGQAYYKDADGKYKTICDSIFSTYEMIWEYGIDLSWDTFYARREDISQSGEHPNPPFTKVILAYPPKPHNNSLTKDKIKKWVEAKDEWVEDDEENQYPFYPKQYEDGTSEETKDWKDHQLQYIVPPYPYIPLSCM